MKRWCESNDVNMHTFQYWRTKLSSSASADSANCVDWAQVASPTKDKRLPSPARVATPIPNRPEADGHIFLHMGRCSVEVAHGFDSAVLSDVLTVLKARC